mmetsp:Transcript_15830/g.32007  ORF Transcript_15830/g.32007 Transcript_15830/m.32007 type:complete len:113 (-) Transcript_15830:135-473(-)
MYRKQRHNLPEDVDAVIDDFLGRLTTRMPPSAPTYPLSPDERFFWATVVKVSNARKHDAEYAKTAAGHLLRDDQAVEAHLRLLQQQAQDEEGSETWGEAGEPGEVEEPQAAD